MKDADIGLIGLGVMGANLALNIADRGYTVAVYNRTAEKTDSFMQEAGTLAERLIACHTLDDLVSAIRPPRPVIIMVKAGGAVDEQIAALRTIIDKSDILIDAGNANFHDTQRRSMALEADDIAFVGMGVSGGSEGARYGPSIMVGGEASSYERIRPILEAIAAKHENDPCCAHFGSDGAGHFVKTIHNGIEYANMQTIAETYDILRHGLALTPAEIGTVFEQWNEGPLKSYLVEITGKVLKASDPESGQPMVDIILDRAGQKGTGRWTAVEAQTLGVPATTIEEAVSARALSALKDERIAAEAVYGKPTILAYSGDHTHSIEQLEQALYAAIIIGYAQGFAVMRTASDDYGWNLPFKDIARVWRAGCIIRSRFLETIMTAYEGADVPDNLLVAPAVSDIVKTAVPGLRAVVAKAIASGLPVPAHAAALSYFDQYRRAQSTANLIQAQRDFFGEHGFERVDRPGEGFHGPWVGKGS